MTKLVIGEAHRKVNYYKPYRCAVTNTGYDAIFIYSLMYFVKLYGHYDNFFFFFSLSPSSSEDKVKVNFINRDGDTIVAEGKIGESLLDLVVEKNLDIDGFGK